METETFGGFKQTASTSIMRLVDKITITAGRQFNLPSAMYRKNGLHRFKAARLFYNKAERKIGIEFITQQEEGTFKLIESGEKARYGAYIVAKNFFFLNDLKAPKKAKRYDYKKVGIKGLGANRPGTLFIIDLKQRDDLKQREDEKD